MGSRERKSQSSPRAEGVRPADRADFERRAAEKQPTFLRELGAFLLGNKKWWLTPIVVVLLVLGALVFLGGTSAAPFIYTIF